MLQSSIRITSIRVEIEYYKPSLSVRKQHSLVQNIIVFNYIAKSESCPTKALSGTRTSRDHAQRSSLHPQLGEGSTCSNQSRTGHLQQVGDKP